MVSFKTLAAVVLLSATAATPAFAQAAIQEPGCSHFTILIWTFRMEGIPTPAARMSPNCFALRGTCAAIGAGVAYCGDRYRSYNFAPDAFSHNHGHLHHRT